MIVMTPEATEAEIAAVKARLETTGVHVLVLPGELTTAIGAIGDPEGVRELGLEGMAGVPTSSPPPSSRTTSRRRSASTVAWWAATGRSA
jgi:3-deoxy-7-phosphoheptulonate synthase